MRAIDFTTYYINQMDPYNAQRLRGDGFDHAIVGMDNSEASVAVVNTLLNAGFTWDAYRVVYSDRPPEPGIDDCVAGILAVYQSRNHSLAALPQMVHLDIEERPAIPTQQQVAAAASRLSYHEIGPAWQVQASCYSGAWVWEKAGWGDWSYLADLGYYLWMNAKQPLWGGWKDDHLIGYQTAYDQPSPIGNVDYSTLRDRSIMLLNQPAL